MSLNIAVVSGLVSSKVVTLPNSQDGVCVKVSQKGRKDGETKDFLVLAYSKEAELLQAKAQSGKRISVFGRIGREKLKDDKYQDVIIASKILTIGDTGSDFSFGALDGDFEFREFGYTPNGAPVLNFSVANKRTFTKGEGDAAEEKTYTTWAKGVLFNEVANNNTELSKKAVPAVVYGQLQSSVWEQANKIEIWGNGLVVAGEPTDVQERGARGETAQSAPAPKAGGYKTKAVAKPKATEQPNPFEDGDSNTPF